MAFDFSLSSSHSSSLSRISDFISNHGFCTKHLLRIKSLVGFCSEKFFVAHCVLETMSVPLIGICRNIFMGNGASSVVYDADEPCSELIELIDLACKSTPQ